MGPPLPDFSPAYAPQTLRCAEIRDQTVAFAVVRDSFVMKAPIVSILPSQRFRNQKTNMRTMRGRALLLSRAKLSRTFLLLQNTPVDSKVLVSEYVEDDLDGAVFSLLSSLSLSAPRSPLPPVWESRRWLRQFSRGAEPNDDSGQISYFAEIFRPSPLTQFTTD